MILPSEFIHFVSIVLNLQWIRSGLIFYVNMEFMLLDYNLNKPIGKIWFDWFCMCECLYGIVCLTIFNSVFIIRFHRSMHLIYYRFLLLFFSVCLMIMLNVNKCCCCCGCYCCVCILMNKFVFFWLIGLTVAIVCGASLRLIT